MLRLVELDVRSLGPMWSAVMAIRKLGELRSVDALIIRQTSALSERKRATPPRNFSSALGYICCCLPAAIFNP
jgi:hypothetical protein